MSGNVGTGTLTTSDEGSVSALASKVEWSQIQSCFVHFKACIFVKLESFKIWKQNQDYFILQQAKKVLGAKSLKSIQKNFQFFKT